MITGSDSNSDHCYVSGGRFVCVMLFYHIELCQQLYICVTVCKCVCASMCLWKCKFKCVSVCACVCVSVSVSVCLCVCVCVYHEANYTRTIKVPRKNSEGSNFAQRPPSHWPLQHQSPTRRIQRFEALSTLY